MNQQPKVTVIIPIYNSELYLDKCISSVINQSLHSLEIILVDDGSTDDSSKICDQYAEKDKRIVVIHKKNEGVAVAENIAIDKANGKYVGFVEADDFIAQDMYEKLYECAEATEADIVKCSFYICIGKFRKEYKNFYGFSEEGEVFQAYKKPQIFRAHPSMWAGIYRRTFLNKFHLRNLITPGATYSDKTWRALTYAYAKRMTILPEALYYYNSDNPDSSSFNENEKCYYKVFQCEETNRILREAGIFDEVKEYAGLEEFISCYNSAKRIQRVLRTTYFEKFRNVLLDLTEGGCEFLAFSSKQKELAMNLIQDNQKQFWHKVDVEHSINKIIKNPVSDLLWKKLTWEYVDEQGQK